MSFIRQVSRALDDEHRANLELLGKVESACVRGDLRDPTLLGALVRQLEVDITRHFDFEEQALFPRLAEAGDGDMAALLAEEHAAIRMVAEEVMPLARAAVAGALDRAAADGAIVGDRGPGHRHSPRICRRCAMSWSAMCSTSARSGRLPNSGCLYLRSRPASPAARSSSRLD